jgi:Asp-tRNA(Asn)/Glu-tRNA(Gln) amidotransferase A subunit family amidase
LSENGDELALASATEQAALIRQKKLSPVELVELYLRRIERIDPALNCFVLVTMEEALGQARGAEEALARREELPPFHGVPILINLIKDVLSTAGCGPPGDPARSPTRYPISTTTTWPA